MATRHQVSIEEYLATSFNGPDREYRDGEVVERNAGESDHSFMQGHLVGLFTLLSLRLNRRFVPMPELRFRVSAEDCLIPDVSVFVDRRPRESVPSQPPQILIEILSPDDRLSAVRGKLEVYRQWGAPNIWLIDPYGKTMYVYRDDGLHEVRSYVIAAYGIEISAAQVFDEQALGEARE